MKRNSCSGAISATYRWGLRSASRVHPSKLPNKPQQATAVQTGFLDKRLKAVLKCFPPAWLERRPRSHVGSVHLSVHCWGWWQLLQCLMGFVVWAGATIITGRNGSDGLATLVKWRLNKTRQIINYMSVAWLTEWLDKGHEWSKETALCFIYRLSCFTVGQGEETKEQALRQLQMCIGWPSFRITFIGT